MKRDEVIIVGGGVSGLATGCYLQMNGYRTRILEMGRATGGVSVSWKRGGYTFDPAMNWLAGSAPPLNFHDVLREVVDMSRFEFVNLDTFVQVEARGKELRVWTDPRRLREEMRALSARDDRTIRQFTDAVERVRDLELPVLKSSDLMTVRDKLALVPRGIPLLAFVRRWRPVSIAGFSERFRDPDLALLFRGIFSGQEDFSIMGMIFTLGWHAMGCAGYPIGGSRRFSDMLEDQYRALGGEVVLGADVARILVEGDAATGVRLVDGQEHGADLVISSADGHTTLYGMLGGERVPPALARLYGDPPLYPGLLLVSLGVAREFEEEVTKFVVPFSETVSGRREADVPWLVARICSFDPGFAPPGGTAVVAHTRTRDPEYWIRLRRDDPDAYRAEKERVARAVVDTLDRRFGDVADRVEVTDVATPATYVRFTNTWQGSYQGWAPVPSIVGHSLPRTIDGLRDFYMTGQWLDPGGGIIRVIMSARHLAQRICLDDGREFAVTPAS